MISRHAKHWATAKRAFPIVTASVAATGTLIAIWQWYFPDSPRFSSQVEVEQVSIPAPLRDAILDNTPISLVRFSPLKRHITMTLTNTGDRPAKNVELQIGHDGIATISNSAAPRHQKDFKQRLSVGDVAVRESIEVEIWDDAKQSSWTVPTIEVCHDGGFQSVPLPRQYSGAIEAIVIQNGLWFAIVIVTLAIFLPGVLLVMFVLVIKRAIEVIRLRRSLTQ